MLRFILRAIGALFTMAALGAVLAALGLGAIFWIYGRDLPNHEQLAKYTPPTISRVYSGEGRIVDEFAKERRLFTPIADIPDLVKQAFISAEDKHFYTHPGYDVTGIVKAVVDYARGKRLRGASTITQQVAKNLLLSADRKAERKIKEIILATRLENTLSKDRILELYLNEIFLGQNSYGVTAAAQTYFNKPLEALLPEEAAYLAALPKAPSDYHPVRQKKRALARRNFVLKEMHENGYLSDEEYARARSAPLRTVQSGDYPAFREQIPPRNYFTDEIRRQLTRNFGENEFFTGGYAIRATMDPEMQQAAARALRAGLEQFDRRKGVWRGTGLKLPEEVLGDEAKWRPALKALEMARDIEGWYPAVVLEVGRTHARIGIEDVPDDEDGHWIAPGDVTWARKRLQDGKLGRKARVAGDLLEVGDVVYVRAITKDEDGSFVRWSLRQIPEIQGGFMAMDVHTGRVIAMQGGFSYQHSVFNRATQATRQPGSAFKPFVYAAALDSGFTPATIIIDAPIEVNTPEGVWRPKNSSNRFYGPTPLRTGIVHSRNLMTVRLAEEVGMDTVAQYAETFGVYDYLNPYLANALGAQETTLYKMVAAYAMIANGGERVEPALVDRVQDRWGRTIFRHDKRICENCDDPDLPAGEGPRITSNRERVIDAVTAYQIRSMMEDVVKRGTASRTVNLPVPVAGKTGTTNESKDAWFIGFTSNIAAGCYIGYDQPRPMGKGAYGGTLCGPVFTEFMKEAIRKYGGGKFGVPPGGRFIKIDRFTGARLPDDATGDNVVAEYFREGEEPVFGVAFDGGFAMGSDLPLFEESARAYQQRTVRTSTGGTATIGGKASFGSVTGGGQY